jgi:hypothetical protein
MRGRRRPNETGLWIGLTSITAKVLEDQHFIRTNPALADHSEGRICCRFDDNPDYMRALGNWFVKQQIGQFQPYFSICEAGQNINGKKVYHNLSIGVLSIFTYRITA